MRTLGRQQSILAGQPASVLVAIDQEITSADATVDGVERVWTLNLRCSGITAGKAVAMCIEQRGGAGVVDRRIVYFTPSTYRRLLEIAAASLTVSATLVDPTLGLVNGVIPPATTGSATATAYATAGTYNAGTELFATWATGGSEGQSDSPWSGPGTVLDGSGAVLNMGSFSELYVWLLDCSQIVPSIALSGGGNYATFPTATWTGGPFGSGVGYAQGTLAVSCGIGTPSVTTAGTGYGALATVPVTVGPPNVPGGVRATAHAVSDAGGGLATFVIDNPGAGYTAIPAFTVGGTGTLGVVAGTLSIVAVTPVGASGFTVLPTTGDVTFSAGTAAAVVSAVTIVNAAGGAVAPIAAPWALTSVGGFAFDDLERPSTDFGGGLSWALSSDWATFVPVPASSGAVAAFTPKLGF